jgi:hypothetical protein
MRSRARAIGEEFAETEAQTEALNAALDRDARRQTLAVEIARERYGSDDVEVGRSRFLVEWPLGATVQVESVDGGYWIAARVWVDADDVVLEDDAREADDA